MTPKQRLTPYLPENAVDDVITLLKNYEFTLKIVNNRSTKHGDFRQLPNKKYQITINHGLNQYQFLMTLIHEVAHLVTHLKFGRVQPHGKEWKTTFQHLMLPFLRPDIFPDKLLRLMAKHFKNPKASTGSDVELSIALKQYSEISSKSFIFEIPDGAFFKYKNRIFTKGAKKRTRYYCVENNSKKTYLFSAHAEVDLIKTN